MARFMTSTDLSGPFVKVNCFDCAEEMEWTGDIPSDPSEVFCEECEWARKHESCEDHPCADCLSHSIDRATDFYELQQDITEGGSS